MKLALAFAGAACLAVLCSAQVLPTAPPNPGATPRVAIMASAPRDRGAIWIQQPNGLLTMYDTVEFKNWSAVKLPPECIANHGSIKVHRSGVVMCTYAATEGSPIRQVWLSVPGLGTTLHGGAEDRRPAQNGGVLETTAAPEVFFSADGQRLYWMQNRLTDLSHGESTTRQPSNFLAWTTDREGGDLRSILNISMPQCACTTGSCNETCPEMMPWTPDHGIDDFFFLTKWVPGQIETSFLETNLYRREAGKWTAHKLDHAVDHFLDAGDHGNIFVYAETDGACCGWVNESSDRTLVNRNGQVTIVFDEFARFGNPDYDVNFSTTVAKISPDTKWVAFTVTADYMRDQEIRLSDQGKANPDELARVKRGIAEMPRSEVVAFSDTTTTAASVSGELIGWIDAERILVVQNGELVTLNATNGALKKTGIKVQSAATVFLP